MSGPEAAGQALASAPEGRLRRLFGRLGLRGRLWLFLGLAFLCLHSLTALLAHRLDDEQSARMVLSDHASSLTLCLLMLDPLHEGGAPLPELILRLRRLDAVNARILHSASPPEQWRDAASLFLRQRIRDSLKGFVSSLQPADGTEERLQEPRASELLPWSKDLVSRQPADGRQNSSDMTAPPHFPPSESFWGDEEDQLTDLKEVTPSTAVPPWIFVTRVERQGPTGLARLLMLPGTNQVDIYISRLFVRLDRNTWLDIHRMSRISPSWPLMLALLGVEALVMVVLTVFVVHRLIAPLNQLVQASDALGRDRAHAPLSESGPPEVAEAARAFNRMSLRIQAALEQHQRMLAAVAHDLRTPLTRLRLRVEQVPDESLRRKLEADINTLSAIMRSSEELGRAQLPQESLRRTDLSAFLDSLVADRLASHLPASESEAAKAPHAPDATLPAERLRFLAETGDAACILPVRAHALRRCLDNLIDNALRYAPHILVRLHRCPQSGDWLVDVEDDGPGIPAEARERVFEPFFRLDPARTRHEGGSGLGLAIARSMARQNHADLHLLERPGGGLIARLIFADRD
ncbi:ATP-binding protein [uncultured Desulfovibrio sp.]|uniref:sensor histidine kinase n=1 Tax=uncultured Desulfovibrio sp. TaxID=167968 RepID=UPI002615B3ED|nr:ATP-binding protein [uncultured Desulfovibrio sp.]